ncbi:MAG: MOSC N-terminal beta barrel domain-containing protein [Phormidesmis sp.]
MATLALSELYIYPIKSAAGIAVNEAQLTSRGLQYDRRWMVVDAQGKFMSQRRFPRMALIRVSIADQHLQITAPGMLELSVCIDDCLGLDSGAHNEPFARLMVEVWGDRTEAVALGTDSARWFSEFIGTDCQLVYMPERSHRPAEHGQLGADQLVSFADAYPYLLISEASLAGLNERLSAKGQTSVTMARFRPNLVVKGCAEPHEEDSWQQIRIGEAVLDLPKLCARCSIPNVNPVTGDYPKDRHGQRGKEPAQTLSTYRYWDKGIWFGQNCVQVNNGDQNTTLRIGDPIEVINE